MAHMRREGHAMAGLPLQRTSMACARARAPWSPTRLSTRLTVAKHGKRPHSRWPAKLAHAASSKSHPVEMEAVEMGAVREVEMEAEMELAVELAIL